MKKISFIIIALSIVSFNLLGQSNNVQNIIKEGVKLHDNKEYKKAIEKFKEALKLNPQSTLATYEMSLSYLELRDFKNASTYSTKVINSNDKSLSVGAYAVKGEALAEMNKVDDAIKLLQEGLLKNGDSFLLHFNIALNYYKIGNLDKTLEHVARAIELDKKHSGAYLLSAYAQKDKDLWIKSIFSFQMFLLLEPDSKRSKNAFEEMLQTMLVKPKTEKPIERSFIQQQLMKKSTEKNHQTTQNTPLLTEEDGIDRALIHQAITATMDSLKSIGQDSISYTVFRDVNKTILNAVETAPNLERTTSFWSFHYPFFKEINNSKYYDTFARYISVSFFPESLKWWENNKSEAADFINWFEKGDTKKQ